MKRIQVTIKNSPATNPKRSLRDSLFDSAESWEFSPSESPVDQNISVYYGESEAGIVAILQDAAEYHGTGESYETAVTEISDAEWNEIKSAMDEMEDDAEFFARMKAKYH